jgi:hypothetical protein
MKDRIDLPLCLMKIGDVHILGVSEIGATGNQLSITDEVIWTSNVQVATDATVAPVKLTRIKSGRLCNLLAVAEGEGFIFVHRAGEQPEAVARYLVHNHQQNYRVALVAAGAADTGADNDPNVRDDDNDPLGEDRQLNPESLTTDEIDLPLSDGVALTSIAHPTLPLPAPAQPEAEGQAPAPIDPA